MSRKEKVRCGNCKEWEQIDLYSGICGKANRAGHPQPATGIGHSCEKGQAMTPTAAESVAKEESEAPC